MMNATIAGRLYNGKAHDYTSKDEDRTMFRGRINYRNPENGEYHWMDAVCFKDFGVKGGLVAWLDEHYSTESSGNDNGGEAIIVTGYVRPAVKKKTIEIKGKKNGKVVKKEIPNVPYDSFEFMIQSATFAPTSQGEGRKKEDVETDDEDFEDFEDLEIADEEEGEEEIEQEEEQEEEAPPVKKKSTTSTKTKQKKTSTTEKSKGKKEETIDDDFFEN